MKVVASLNIPDAEKLTPLQRAEVADWLKMHASMVVKEGANYAKGFKGKIFGR